jgi:hypothetical protein
MLCVPQLKTFATVISKIPDQEVLAGICNDAQGQKDGETAHTVIRGLTGLHMELLGARPARRGKESTCSDWPCSECEPSAFYFRDSPS